MGESRSFPAWAITACDECGEEFQVTRTLPRIGLKEVICGNCEMYRKGYKDGFRDGVTKSKEEIKALEKLVKVVDLKELEQQVYKALKAIQYIKTESKEINEGTN